MSAMVKSDEVAESSRVVKQRSTVEEVVYLKQWRS